MLAMFFIYYVKSSSKYLLIAVFMVTGIYTSANSVNICHIYTLESETDNKQ